MHWLQHHWRLLMIIDQISVLAAGVFCGGRLHCVWPNWWYWRAGFHWPTLHQNNTAKNSHNLWTPAFPKPAFLSTLFKPLRICERGFVWSSRRSFHLKWKRWPLTGSKTYLLSFSGLWEYWRAVAGKQKTQLHLSSPPLCLSCELEGAMPMYSLGVKTRMGENLSWALASSKTFLLSFSGAREEWQAGKQWGASWSKKSNLTCL